MSDLASLFSIKNDTDDQSSVLGAPKIKIQGGDQKNSNLVIDEFYKSVEEAASIGAVKNFKDNKGLESFLIAIFDLSPYLRDLAKQYPNSVLECMELGFNQAMINALAGLSITTDDEAELMRCLRHAKRKAALICGLGDLGGWWSAAKVSAEITRTADETVNAAVNFLLLQAHQKGKLNLPDPLAPAKGSGYTVLAMGKQGARELNYSSDIDIIVLFDPCASAVIDPDESVALFVRLTKSLVRIMQERTEDGYVFRTDLRLRPDPGSMPLAIPVGVAMNYYESRGQNWERAAMIKARVVAGDLATGESILHELIPFIWRRYLDYAAIADVHSIKRQIQSHRNITTLTVPGHNVKLGRGGIREIEFFVQTQQLIAGGRVPELRGRRTIETLNTLVEQGWIEGETRDDLSLSYAFLRDVEHRLQMIDDAQTHTLPESDSDLLVVSKLCGFQTIEEFSLVLTNHLMRVEEHYAALFEEAPELSQSGNLSFTGDEDDPGTMETLKSMGFQTPSKIISIVRSWHFGRYPAMQSSDAREKLTEITPALLQALADAGTGDEALLAFDDFIQGLPRGFQLFSLLHANPKLLSLLVTILGAAPRLASVITRRPHVFDGLLEPGFFEAVPTKDQLSDSLARSLSQARDYEDGLDRARVFADEQRFLIGIRVISQVVPPHKVGLLFTDLAEVMLKTMVDWVRKPFEQAHGVVPGSNFLLLGMGNLGTRELTASSDLDLILLYEYQPEMEESNGAKPLHASQYFGRFTQRLIAAMGAPTADGIIYEMDFRLRPSGQAGPIATSLHAFEQYYKKSAWTWEKQALTRARTVVGDDTFTNTVTNVITNLLSPSDNAVSIKKDILEMRLDMDGQKPTNNVWDIKLIKGGLIDIEFIAQWLVLLGKAERGRSTTEVLKMLDVNEARPTLLEAHHLYASILQLQRLCLGQSVPLSEAPTEMINLILNVLELPDMKSAEAHLIEMQNRIRGIFLEILKGETT